MYFLNLGVKELNRCVNFLRHAIILHLVYFLRLQYILPTFSNENV